jgi:hypothetical protein
MWRRLFSSTSVFRCVFIGNGIPLFYLVIIPVTLANFYRFVVANACIALVTAGCSEGRHNQKGDNLCHKCLFAVVNLLGVGIGVFRAVLNSVVPRVALTYFNTLLACSACVALLARLGRKCKCYCQNCGNSFHTSLIFPQNKSKMLIC